MKMLSSTSSQVAAFGHDAATQTLRVRFRSGDEWEYADVSEEKFAEMQASESQGKFIHNRVKPYHSATKREQNNASLEANSLAPKKEMQ